MNYRERLLSIFASGGTYDLEALRRRCTGSPDANLEVTLALDQLRYQGVVEVIEGAYRLVRTKGETQKGLWD